MRNSSKNKEVASYIFWDLGKDKNIHVEKVNLKAGMEQIVMDPHRINFYAIRWVVRGEGTVYVDNIPVTVKPNLLFVGTPKQITFYDFPKDYDIEAYILAFNQNLITMMNFEKDAQSFLDNLTSPLMVYPDAEAQKFIKGIFELMIMEFQQSLRHQSERILAGLTKSLLFYLFRIQHRESASQGINQGYVNLYRQFLNEVENHYKTDHYVADYTDRLHVTEKRLNRACKAVTQQTASNIIQKRIDYEIKRLLFYSTKTVKEIGYEMGFNDPSYFNKFFKSNNGHTPGEFRQALQKRS